VRFAERGKMPATAARGEWDDDRIWTELDQRLAAAGRPPIQRDELIERDILDHRVRVCDPMQHGRVSSPEMRPT